MIDQAPNLHKPSEKAAKIYKNLVTYISKESPEDDIFSHPNIGVIRGHNVSTMLDPSYARGGTDVIEIAIEKSGNSFVFHINIQGIGEIGLTAASSEVRMDLQSLVDIQQVAAVLIEEIEEIKENPFRKLLLGTLIG